MKKKPAKKTKRVMGTNRADPHKAMYNSIIEEYIARNGWDPVGIARCLGVADRTIYRWAEARSDVKLAIEDGKKRFETERPDAERIRLAEEALFKRVMGYEFTEKKVTVDEKGESETITVGQIAPDVSAIKYFLKNRCPERWTDRQDVKVSGDGSVPLVMLVMDDGSKIAANEEKDE